VLGKVLNDTKLAMSDPFNHPKPSEDTYVSLKPVFWKGIFCHFLQKGDSNKIDWADSNQESILQAYQKAYFSWNFL
jgi:hypothetical protein